MKIKYQGRDVEAEELHPLSSSEQWNEYLLDDQNTIRIKTILIRIFKLSELDGKEILSANGEPAYRTHTQTIVKNVQARKGKR